ncbi:MAG: DNA mismatch repair endonuclease MutL, partial [Deltaproteobacteria bacterium]|nr:DNA mismatch repair endonuclease MutL [Deltaproteobacteria bacterium]
MFDTLSARGYSKENGTLLNPVDNPMANIQILPESLINHIAAGEVVERPASVLKELVENSIDSGADQILVSLKNAGKDHISVLDNGSGMNERDALLAIERHATSKIKEVNDLNHIQTLGFRGEALAAISAVSRFELTTCADERQGGFQVRMEGGQIRHRAKTGFPKGTRITVENLFFNTPARQKFMKSNQTEYHHLHELLIHLALGYPHIQFRLSHDKAIIFNFPKGQSFAQRAEQCFGSEIVQPLIECSHQESYLRFSGLFSPPEHSRTTKRWQHTLVNDRYVICKSINHGITEGYKTLLMKNSHPVFFVKLYLSPDEIDVNVHPAKTEIRLKNPSLIHTIFSEQISRLLKSGVRNKIFNPRAHENLPSDAGESNPARAESHARGAVPSRDLGLSGQAEPHLRADSTFIEPNQQIGFETHVTRPDNTSDKPSQTYRPTPREPMFVRDESPFSFSKNQPVVQPAQTRQIKGAFKAIGQLHNKYVLAEADEKLVLIDQHAAHERVRFEEIKSQFYSNSLATHPLMIPQLLELPPQDGLLLELYQESWAKLGFVIEHFGG